MSIALATKGVISGIGGGTGQTIYAEELSVDIDFDILLAGILEDSFAASVQDDSPEIEMVGCDETPWFLAAGIRPYSAYQADGMPSYAASFIDLTGNGHNLAEGVAPSWNATDGWTFDGSTTYLITDFIPENDKSQSVFVQFDNVTNNGYLFGVSMGFFNEHFYLWPNKDMGVGYGHGGILNQQPSVASGNLGMAGPSAYRNGVYDGAIYPGVDFNPPAAAYIGGRYYTQTGGMSFPIAANITRVVFFDEVLTADQAAAIASAMAG